MRLYRKVAGTGVLQHVGRSLIAIVQFAIDLRVMDIVMDD